MSAEELLQLVKLLEKLASVQGLYCPLKNNVQRVLRQIFAQDVEDICGR